MRPDSVCLRGLKNADYKRERLLLNITNGLEARFGSMPCLSQGTEKDASYRRGCLSSNKKARSAYRLQAQPGRSDRTRTCGLMVPNHPLYQLSHTPTIKSIRHRPFPRRKNRKTARRRRRGSGEDNQEREKENAQSKNALKKDDKRTEQKGAQKAKEPRLKSANRTKKAGFGLKAQEARRECNKERRQGRTRRAAHKETEKAGKVRKNAKMRNRQKGKVNAKAGT